MRHDFAPAPEGVPPLPPGEPARLAARDGFPLRAGFFEPQGVARGTVVLLHGRAEFIEKYAEVISELLARGYAVATLDWRGQGASGRMMVNPRKGHVEDFTDYELDLDALLAEMHRRAMPQPFGLLAHSTGAAVALHHLARGKTVFRRAVLCAPLVEIGRLSWRAGARALSRGLSLLGLAGFYVPTGSDEATNDKPFAGNILTGDARRYAWPARWYQNAPDLAIGDPTIGWVEAAFESLADFASPDFGQNNRTPVLMLIGSADRVIEPRAAADLAVRMRGASAVMLPGARHEILFETDDIRAAFWAAFDAFMVLDEERAAPRA